MPLLATEHPSPVVIGCSGGLAHLVEAPELAVIPGAARNLLMRYRIIEGHPNGILILGRRDAGIGRAVYRIVFVGQRDDDPGAWICERLA